MELIDAFVEASQDHSLREAGKLVGVSHNTVARWRKGERTDLQPATRRGIVAFLTQTQMDLGQSSYDLDSAGDRDGGASLREALSDEVAALRWLEGAGPAGEEQAIKLDYLELTKRVLERRGPLPDWWYRLKGMVVDGAL